MTKPKPWTDTTATCPRNTNCKNDDCELWHDDDAVTVRYILTSQDGTVEESFGRMDRMVEDMRDFNQTSPFRPGEATLTDTAAKTKMDAAEFITKYCR